MTDSIEGFKPPTPPSGVPTQQSFAPPESTTHPIPQSDSQSTNTNSQPGESPRTSTTADDGTLTPDSATAADAPAKQSENRFQGVVVGRRRQHRLDVELVRGGIENVDARAVVLGVYRNVEPKGPSAKFDQLLGGAITEFTERRMFSAAAGDIFILPTGTHPVRAEFVVFAGLGEFQDFSDEAQILVATNVIRSLLHAGIGEFATLLFGGSSGYDVRRSVQNLVKGFVQGLVEADTRHNFRRVTLCEFDNTRYEQVKDELYHLVSTSLFDAVQVTLDETVPTMKYVDSAFSDYRPAASDEQPTYLTVRQFNSPQDPSRYTFESAVLTTDSKATVIQSRQSCNKRDFDALLANLRMASHLDLSDFSAKLIPLIFDSSITTLWDKDEDLRQTQLVVAHDYQASQIPWETLELGGIHPALIKGLTRKYVAEDLTVAKWLEQRRYGATLDVLLVVNPTEDLPGAEREGKLVLEELQRIPMVRVDKVWGSDATRDRLITAFRSGKYDVIHYAGHAHFDPVQRSRSGIFCAGKEILNGDDLANLSRLPGLVFFNACESGRLREANSEVRSRTQQSVGFAESFLRGGVANFAGTYWPVGDEPAATFAREFYRRAVDGQPLGKAVLESRQEVKKLKVNDWADYMFYGSPSFVLKNRTTGDRSESGS